MNILAGRFNRLDIIRAYSIFASDWQVDTTSFKTTEVDKHGRRHVNKQEIHAQAMKLDKQAWQNVRPYPHLSLNAQRFYDALCDRFGYTNPERVTTIEQIEDAIEKGMALAFFASAYADQADECGDPLTGEIMNQIPDETDPAALHAAETLVMGLEQKNGLRLYDIYSTAPGTASPENWGHYAAMQAMGHGVGLSDVGVKRDLVQVPYTDFGSHSLEKDYFEPKDECPECGGDFDFEKAEGVVRTCADCGHKTEPGA